ncbi:MAG: hypothetical protein A3A26_01945 [Candidatus Zambryskibacteria bacterium RIFCSPLOWO2_01_FULL_47_14]|uniref:Uncharacterized protein n=1 Tax=Candidatus Zambryskibacteria bacterium RIFCSPLOWO2_01_FULL_47_14 TaxID=1802763 RepID=A0A1G2U763_9BACT|nr:MAG: hypothetical protein A3A26_01945 [Candidatus Zambryskibacteria bacterium RIFCSPLOWO2_01_FULL_47_14]
MDFILVVPIKGIYQKAFCLNIILRPRLRYAEARKSEGELRHDEALAKADLIILYRRGHGYA